MSADPETHQEEENRLPASLQTELKAAFVAPREIPASLDERIRGAIPRLPVAEPRPWYSRPRWIAAAAAAAILVSLWFRAPEPAELSRVAGPGNPPAYLAAQTTDVLDAFQLARLLRDRVPHLEEGGWDVDRNGLVDQADVEFLLDLAVRLES